MTKRPHLDVQRPLDAPIQQFDLNQITAEIWLEDAGIVGHNAITLHHTPNLRLVLLTMHTGSRLKEHATSAPFSIHVINGYVRLITDSRTLDLRANTVVTCDGGIEHAVEAIEESVCLLTLAGPTAPTQAGREAMQPRGAGVVPDARAVHGSD